MHKLLTSDADMRTHFQRTRDALIQRPAHVELRVIITLYALTALVGGAAIGWVLV